MDGHKFYNVNVGVLGHVDSGKTSLVATLSTQLSTAALDKHPQSKERGITLDLGFSAFTIPLPPGRENLQCDALQITLVDCPGHASLVRTILGGAQIMDMMILVVDVTKGIQKQTAECLVVGELTTDKMIVVLNKTDLLPLESKGKIISKASKMLLKTFAFTKFKTPQIIAMSAKQENSEQKQGIERIRHSILEILPPEPRKVEGKFLMSVDHCFPVKGHGTVLTGTVLQGDRVGICLTQLDPDKMERGWLCAPGSVLTFRSAIASVKKIKFYIGEIKSKQKLHITIGHSTVMADIEFFGLPNEGNQIQRQEALDRDHSFDLTQDYLWQDNLYGIEGRPAESLTSESKESKYYGPQWCLLRFSQDVIGPPNALLIGSKLDDSSSGQSCRLAMHGRIVSTLNPSDPNKQQTLQVFKLKSKIGAIERNLPDGKTAICKGFFKKESDFTAFIGMKVKTDAGDRGILQGNFGNSGKVKIFFKDGLPKSGLEKSKVILEFKKFVIGGDRKHILQ